MVGPLGWDTFVLICINVGSSFVHTLISYSMNHTCGYCVKNVYPRTLYKLSCNLCGSMYHTQCANISKNVFKNFSNDQKINWMCSCCTNTFPFNHIEDDEIFLESPLPSNNLDAFHLNSDKLLFNPYELYCDEQEMLPNDDYDPDTHYNQTPHTQNSK